MTKKIYIVHPVDQPEATEFTTFKAARRFWTESIQRLLPIIEQDRDRKAQLSDLAPIWVKAGGEEPTRMQDIYLLTGKEKKERRTLAEWAGWKGADAPCPLCGKQVRFTTKDQIKRLPAPLNTSLATHIRETEDQMPAGTRIVPWICLNCHETGTSSAVK